MQSHARYVRRFPSVGRPSSKHTGSYETGLTQSYRMAHKKLMLLIGSARLHSNLLGKPDSDIPLVRSTDKATDSAMQSRNTCGYELLIMASAQPSFSAISSSLMVPRQLLPYLLRIFHPKLLKIMGQIVPWRNLNHVIKLVDIMNANARNIYETKKCLLNSGDEATIKQVGDGKDIISLLSASSNFFSLNSELI
jgi:hypothetical protein